MPSKDLRPRWQLDPVLRRVDAGGSPGCLGLPTKQMNGNTDMELCALQGLTPPHTHTHTLSSLPSLPEALSQAQSYSHEISGDCSALQTWTFLYEEGLLGHHWITTPLATGRDTCVWLTLCGYGSLRQGSIFVRKLRDECWPSLSPLCVLY